ncbi:MAG TPA: hypothetical protein VGG14_14630 [Candidatus Sulfotelmatobacter sp.]
MKLYWLIPAFCLLTTSISTQAGPAPTYVYAESFRQGTTRIIEDKFELKLTPHDRTFSEHVKDSQGFDHYLLSIVPIGPEGDTTITRWQVKLVDLTHRFYNNILISSLQPGSADNPRNQLFLLDPSNFVAVPVKAKRIIKVEGFYVVLQVKDYHFTPIDSPYLDSMTLAVELTNTDPRPATDTAK